MPGEGDKGFPVCISDKKNPVLPEPLQAGRTG